MGAQESRAPQPGPQASADLRWCCDEEWLPFASTDEVEPLTGTLIFTHIFCASGRPGA